MKLKIIVLLATALTASLLHAAPLLHGMASFKKQVLSYSDGTVSLQSILDAYDAFKLPVDKERARLVLKVSLNKTIGQLRIEETRAQRKAAEKKAPAPRIHPTRDRITSHKRTQNRPTAPAERVPVVAANSEHAYTTTQQQASTHHAPVLNVTQRTYHDTVEEAQREREEREEKEAIQQVAALIAKEEREAQQRAVEQARQQEMERQEREKAEHDLQAQHTADQAKVLAEAEAQPQAQSAAQVSRAAEAQHDAQPQEEAPVIDEATQRAEAPMIIPTPATSAAHRAPAQQELEGADLLPQAQNSEEQLRIHAEAQPTEEVSEQAPTAPETLVAPALQEREYTTVASPRIVASPELTVDAPEPAVAVDAWQMLEILARQREENLRQIAAQEEQLARERAAAENNNS